MSLLDFKAKNKMSYRDLSKRTKIPISTLHRICQGHPTSSGTLARLHEATKLPLSDLIPERGEK